MSYLFRRMTEGDYDKIIRVVDEWWDGRKMAAMLPRMFFIHFQNTSFITEADHEPVAFLSGFISQSYPEQAYIHFVGVHPQHRRKGLARKLYDSFLGQVRQFGCREVHSVTAPVNKPSVAFHRQMGFQVAQGGTIEGVPFVADYDGPGQDRVLFLRTL